MSDEVIGVMILIISPYHLLAADGDLDPAFGIAGIATAGFSNDNLATAIAIQPDGKILAAGEAHYMTGHDASFVLVRYNRDGALDTTFGSGGKVITDFSPYGGVAHAIAIQSDGNIIVVGTTGSFLALAAARYQSDGSLDTTFGIGGKLIDNNFRNPCCILIQPEGKILIAGTVPHGSCCGFPVARYNTDGSLDSSFGIMGRVTTDFSGVVDAANAIAMQPDGKIIVLGTTIVAPTSYLNHSSFALARYDRDGALDVTFGREGKVITDFNFDGWDDGRALAIQPDGKIVAAGAGLVEPSGLRLARYNSDGSLDSTFGDQGKVPWFNSPDAASLALQPDGKILVAGALNDATNELVRYNENGSLDLSFGAGGYIFLGNQFQVGGGALALQSDGKIIAAGDRFAVSRYSTVLDLIDLDRTTAAVNTSFTATFSGANFTGQTYFDVRFRSPQNSADQVALNWQQGLSAPHRVAADTPAGTYVVTAIRPHKDKADSGGDFLTVSATLTVAP